jgi:hypothetical protein
VDKRQKRSTGARKSAQFCSAWISQGLKMWLVILQKGDFMQRGLSIFNEPILVIFFKGVVA